MESYYQRYKENGFQFSDELLSNYALSLVTKPFVILCGISGTGKSKIAQLFAIPDRVVQDAANGLEDPVPETTTLEGYITMTVSGGLWHVGDRANFRYSDVAFVLSPEDAERVEAHRLHHLDNNLGGGNFSDTYSVCVDTGDEEERQIQIQVYFQRAHSPLFRIRFRSKRGEDPKWDSSGYFKRNYRPGEVVRFERVGDRHLRITPADEEAIASAQADREAEIRLLDTTCFVSVRSNWIDSTELIGYYNQLTGNYQMKKVLRFLLQASDYPEVPHFLILDEMNLSKVEHYFSDFLSCIESRYVEDGQVKQEPITLHIGESELVTTDEYYEQIDPEIEVPTNLYITGTINVDDSTQPISQKVLDRANMIEFNEVHLDGFDTEGIRLRTFPDFQDVQQPSIKQLDALPEFVKDTLRELLEVLRPDNLHFGYRTIAEIACFITHAVSNLGLKREDAARYALDVQILQKILPKFNGSAAKIGKSLSDLIQYLSGSNDSIDQFVLSDIDNIDAELDHSRYPRSLRKALRMYRKLIEQGFVNFIE